jgi:hypothetical protein
MSLEELKELNTYGDEGWKLDIDEDNKNSNRVCRLKNKTLKEKLAYQQAFLYL